MNDYSKHVTKDGRLKRKKCLQCKTTTLYRYFSSDSIPNAMGGTENYMSMERFWAQNPGEVRRKEDALAKVVAERHNDRVTSNIDKQRERQGSDKRHQGYGKGHKEQRLNSGN